MSTSNAIDKMINTMSKEDIVKACADSKMELMRIHASEMKEVLEWVNNIVNDPMITPRIQQTWKANELLDKYGHLLGDGK